VVAVSGHAVVRRVDGAWQLAYVALVAQDLDAVLAAVPDGWRVEVVAAQPAVPSTRVTFIPGPMCPGLVP
jgi:hypothetical protein